MKQMIAYCGLDCEKCDAYIATINNDENFKKQIAKHWAELNNAPITPEMINCLGCRIDSIKTPYCSYMCEIRQCAIKNGVATCGSCAKVKDCKTVGQIFDNNTTAKHNLELD